MKYKVNRKVLMIASIFFFAIILKSSADTVFSDFFTGAVIDDTKWTEVDPGGLGGSVGNVQQNNVLSIIGNGTWGDIGLTTLNTYDRSVGNITISADVTVSDCGSENTGVGLGYGDMNIVANPGDSYVVTHHQGVLKLFHFSNGDAPSIVSTSFSCANDIPFHIDLVVKQAGGADLYINDSSVPDVSVATGTFSNRSFYLQNIGSVESYDNVEITEDVVVPVIPTTPANLNAIGGDGRVTLTWTVPVEDEVTNTDYLIEYRAGSDSFVTINDGVSTQKELVIAGLTNGLDYSFKVSAVSVGGISDPSNIFNYSLPSLEYLLTDNFTGTVIDSQKWTEYDSIEMGGLAGNVQQNDSLSIFGDGNWGANGLVTVDTYDRTTDGDLTFSMDITKGNCGASEVSTGVGYGNFNITDNPGNSYVIAQNGGVIKLFYFYDGEMQMAATTFSCVSGVPFHIELVILQAGGAQLYINNTLATSIDAGTFTNKSFYLQNIDAGDIYDNVSISKTFIAPAAPVAQNVNITGRENVDSILTGNYDFSDINGNAEGASIYRWLVSDTSNGEYVPIAGATSRTYLLTENELGKYLKFEVAPVSVIEPTNGAVVSSFATDQIGVKIPFVNHILSTGQSLSIGHNGEPALSTTQPFINLMLSGASLVPLFENTKETMSSAMANFITGQSQDNSYQSVVTMNGVNGLGYADLKKGTGPYDNGISQINAAKLATENDLGKLYRVAAVTTVHGETDHSIGSGNNYESYLVEWQNDYETNIKAITGQDGVIPMFIDQMSSFTGYGSSTSEIPAAQLAAAQNNVGKIYLVGPKYFLNYSDNWHLNNLNYRWLGEYYGKVMSKVLLDGQQWKPLAPETITRSGNNVFVKFHVPEGSLQFDTTLVDAVVNYGFEFYDDLSSASIDSVELVNGNTIKIVLDDIPTGQDQRIRYAHTGIPNSGAGAHVAGSVKGNLRDTDATVSQYGNTLYNWSVQFNKTIGTIDEDSPVTIADLASGSFNTNKTVTLTCDDNGGSGCDKIYYTIDGSDPNTNSLIYTNPLDISQNTTLKFFAQDNVENSEIVQTRSYIIDTINPNTAIDSSPASATSENFATFIFSATEDSTFECQLDEGVYVRCVSPKQYSDLAIGSHTFRVRAVDQLNNVDQTPAEYIWTITEVLIDDNENNDDQQNDDGDQQGDDEQQNVDIPNPKLFFGERRKSFSAILRSNNIKLKNTTTEVANGRVQIKKGNKLISEIAVDANGFWEVNFKAKKFRIHYLNQSGAEISVSKKYELKLDTEKPEIFLNGPLYVKHRGSVMSWRGNDNNDVNYYKVAIGGKMIKTEKNQIIIPSYAPKGLQSVTIKAYDKAGNKTSKKANLFVTW